MIRGLRTRRQTWRAVLRVQPVAPSEAAPVADRAGPSPNIRRYTAVLTPALNEAAQRHSFTWAFTGERPETLH